MGGRYMSIAQAKRFTLAEYHKLAELGFFHEDDHIELMGGEIIQMVAKGRAHETCLRKLLKELPKLLDFGQKRVVRGYYARTQND
jgi:Uma2 family endonuclease